MRLAALSLLLLVAVGARAQSFTVVSSSPADHATSVALDATLSLTFSQTTYPYKFGFNPTVVFFPTDAAVTGTPSRSADGRTLSYALTLQPDTRYVVLVLDVRAEDGTQLSAPYALNFTTGASNGPLTIRGNVTGEGGLAPDGSIVALVTGDVNTGDIQIVAADVVEGAAASLPYALGPVPIGLYTAGAVLLPLPLGSSTDGFGYGLYDPEGDGTPNPIFGTTGINIAVAAPPPRTALDGYDEVQAAADETTGAPSGLVGIDPSLVDTTGASPVWTYRFEGACTEARVVRLGLFVLPVAAGDDVCPDPAVPFVGLDSDDALMSAEIQGGDAFRAAHPGETVVVTMSLRATSPADAVWTVNYAASGGDALSVEVPFFVDAAEAGPGETTARLALRSANPSRGAVEVSLTLDAPAETRISVIDAQGRTVAVLLNGSLGAGDHAVRWTPTADVPAGVYWLVVRSGGHAEALAVTRIR